MKKTLGFAALALLGMSSLALAQTATTNADQAFNQEGAIMVMDSAGHMTMGMMDPKASMKGMTAMSGNMIMIMHGGKVYYMKDKKMKDGSMMSTHMMSHM